jgi:hypothetical protein
VGDPTVVCRSCGITASHAPGDPMALCPSCGAALPLTLEVREAREAAPPDRPGLRRPEPMWDTGASGSPVRRGPGWVLWIAIVLAVAAALALWQLGPVVRIGP